MNDLKKDKVEIFLPHTQYTQNNFYRILSTRRNFFTAYSVSVEYFVPHTQQARKNLENFAVSFTAYSVHVK
jgi:hypothetical protein